MNFPLQFIFKSIFSSLQWPIYPLNICTPRIPKTTKKSKLIRATLNKLGIAFSKELTIVFMPSSFDIIRRGLNALNALNPRRNVKLF
jgi:hypothetical protein